MMVSGWSPLLLTVPENLPWPLKYDNTHGDDALRSGTRLETKDHDDRECSAL
jgi:hypothetical protein